MRSWLHKGLGWFVLAATLVSLPGPASKACACARMAAGSACAQLGNKDCAAHVTATTATTSRGTAQISRAACCRAKFTEAHAAETPTQVQLERHGQQRAASSALAAPPTARRSTVHESRPPPPRTRRESASPPASYLSDYLRL